MNRPPLRDLGLLPRLEMHSEIHLRVALRSTPDAAGSELYRCNNVDFEVRPGVLSGRLAAKLSGSDSSLESMTIGLPGCPLAWGGFPFCIVGLTNRTSKCSGARLWGQREIVFYPTLRSSFWTASLKPCAQRCKRVTRGTNGLAQVVRHLDSSAWNGEDSSVHRTRSHTRCEKGSNHDL